MPSDIYQDIPDLAHIVLAEVDIVGARLLRERYPHCVTIFVTAPPRDLLRRIRQRADEDMTHIDLVQRMETARTHIQAAKEFDYLVYNEKNRLDKTIQAVAGIISAERHRVLEGFALEDIVPESDFNVAQEALTVDED